MCSPCLITILHEVVRLVNPFVQIYLKSFRFLLYVRERVRGCKHMCVPLGPMCWYRHGYSSSIKILRAIAALVWGMVCGFNWKTNSNILIIQDGEVGQ